MTSGAPRLPLCPSWCTGEHRLSDDLRLTHHSEHLVAPAVERVANAHGSIDPASVVRIAVNLEETEGDTWVRISPDDELQRSMVLSIESTKRMARELKKLLDGLA